MSDQDVTTLPWRQCPVGICVDENPRYQSTRGSSGGNQFFTAPMRIVAPILDSRLARHMVEVHNAHLLSAVAEAAQVSD